MGILDDNLPDSPAAEGQLTVSTDPAKNQEILDSYGKLLASTTKAHDSGLIDDTEFARRLTAVQNAILVDSGGAQTTAAEYGGIGMSESLGGKVLDAAGGVLGLVPSLVSSTTRALIPGDGGIEWGEWWGKTYGDGWLPKSSQQESPFTLASNSSLPKPLRIGVGLVGEILTDPLTYTGVGVAESASRGALNALERVGAREGLDLATQVAVASESKAMIRAAADVAKGRLTRMEIGERAAVYYQAGVKGVTEDTLYRATRSGLHSLTDDELQLLGFRRWVGLSPDSRIAGLVRKATGSDLVSYRDGVPGGLATMARPTMAPLGAGPIGRLQMKIAENATNEARAGINSWLMALRTTPRYDMLRAMERVRTTGTTDGFFEAGWNKVASGYRVRMFRDQISRELHGIRLQNADKLRDSISQLPTPRLKALADGAMDPQRLGSALVQEDQDFMRWMISAVETEFPQLATQENISLREIVDRGAVAQVPKNLQKMVDSESIDITAFAHNYAIVRQRLDQAGFHSTPDLLTGKTFVKSTKALQNTRVVRPSDFFDLDAIAPVLAATKVAEQNMKLAGHLGGAIAADFSRLDLFQEGMVKLRGTFKEPVEAVVSRKGKAFYRVGAKGDDVVVSQGQLDRVLGKTIAETEVAGVTALPIDRLLKAKLLMLGDGDVLILNPVAVTGMKGLLRPSGTKLLASVATGADDLIDLLPDMVPSARRDLSLRLTGNADTFDEWVQTAANLEESFPQLAEKYAALNAAQAEVSSLLDIVTSKVNELSGLPFKPLSLDEEALYHGAGLDIEGRVANLLGHGHVVDQETLASLVKHSIARGEMRREYLATIETAMSGLDLPKRAAKGSKSFEQVSSLFVAGMETGRDIAQLVDDAVVVGASESVVRESLSYARRVARRFEREADKLAQIQADDLERRAAAALSEVAGNALLDLTTAAERKAAEATQWLSEMSMNSELAATVQQHVDDVIGLGAGAGAPIARAQAGIDRMAALLEHSTAEAIPSEVLRREYNKVRAALKEYDKASKDLLVGGEKEFALKLLNAPNVDVLKLGGVVVNADSVTATRIVEMMRKYDNVQWSGLARAMSQMTTFLRAQMMFSPGFSVRNFLGGLYTNVRAGISASSYFEFNRYEMVARAARAAELVADRAGESGVTAALAAKRLWDEIPEARGLRDSMQAIMRETNFAEVGRLQDLADQMTVGLERFERVNRALARGSHKMDETVARFAKNATTLSGGWSGKLFGDAGAFNPKIAGTVQEYAKSGVIATPGVEFYLRGQLMLDGLVKGLSFDESVNRVMANHYDYGAIGSATRRLKQTTAPFITWSINNVPRQLELMAANPQRYRREFLVFGSDRQREGDPFTPQYQQGVFFGAGTEQWVLDKRVTPTADLWDLTELLGGAAQDGSPIQLLTDNMNPVLQFVAQRATDSRRTSANADYYSPAWTQVPLLGPAMFGLMKASGNGFEDPDTGQPQVAGVWGDFIESTLPLLSRMGRLSDSRQGNDDARDLNLLANWISFMGITVAENKTDSRNRAVKGIDYETNQLIKRMVPTGQALKSGSVKRLPQIPG